MSGTSGPLRHTKRSRYRCSLPGLAEFAGNRCTEPEVPRIGSPASSETTRGSLAQRAGRRKKTPRRAHFFALPPLELGSSSGFTQKTLNGAMPSKKDGGQAATVLPIAANPPSRRPGKARRSASHPVALWNGCRAISLVAAPRVGYPHSGCFSSAPWPAPRHVGARAPRRQRNAPVIHPGQAPRNGAGRNR